MTVEEENEWIEKRFNCNITDPVIGDKEIELICMGFDVQPRRDPRQVPGSTFPERKIRYVEAQMAVGQKQINLFGQPNLKTKYNSRNA